IVSNSEHESNIAPWLDLARVGVETRFWNIDPDSRELSLDALSSLMGPRTRLVSVTHVSNIFGTINPIREIADIVHQHDALLCVDGVAFAPHRAIDVRALDADFYVFSCYKTFGPHHALLYGKLPLLRDLPSQNHALVANDNIPYKFQPGNVNYELSYGMTGVMDYLRQLTTHDDGNSNVGSDTAVDDRAAVHKAFDMIAEHEEMLGTHLLDFLRDKPNTHIIGWDSADPARRVSIISFTVDGFGNSDIVRTVDEHGVGIRFGHFYSARLIEALGLIRDEGVVRVSMAHYNTVDEVMRLTETLDRLF
ncbi:MAG: aminotransferase class V-fold PLP-dependent enzyme, partial [Gemmatimonadota bacterium]